MAVIRTRFLFWLIKAYIKKWGRVILFSFFVGLVCFFLLLKLSPFLLRSIPFEKKVIVGMSGAYTLQSFPKEITKKISRGLTLVQPDGSIKPDLAMSWEIHENGKSYIFHLRKNLSFSNGVPFTSKNIAYDFVDVKVEKPDPYTIQFTLKDPYAPFLVTVSKPIFYKGYIGVGDYTINTIELNGNFIKSLQLTSVNNRFKKETYIFYPTPESLKIAFVLGEITKTSALTDTKVYDTTLEEFPNLKKEQKLSYERLVTLFFNTSDTVVSDKKLRSGLSYGIPDKFPDGERVYFPYSPHSLYYNTELSSHTQDFVHAKLLVDSSLQSSSSSALPTLHMTTLTKYKRTAKLLADAWQQIGVQTTIEEVETVPDTFQMYLGDFNVPQDPDQYSLWHTAQPNNITKFRNLRIDKLLEDGRTKVDQSERIKIYYDFQKYLQDESPAIFLYFPYEYEFTRK